MRLKGLVLASLMLVPLIVSAEQWSTRTPLTQFNSESRDLELWLSADAQTAYFSSDRPVTNFDNLDIYGSKLIDGVWAIPVALLPPSIAGSWDGHPSVTIDGRYMYFFSTRGGGYEEMDLYVSENINGVWQAPVNLGPNVNSSYGDGSPFIAPDGQTLYFCSDRPGGYGLGDIYYSKKVDGVWQTPVNMGPVINTADNDGPPTLSYTGKYLFYGFGGRDSHQADIVRAEKVNGEWTTPVVLPNPINTTYDESVATFNDCTNTLFFASMAGQSWDIYSSTWLDMPDANPCERLIIPEGEWRVRVTLLESTGALKSDLFIDAPLAIEKPLIKNSLKHIGSVVETPFISGEELVFHIEINGESEGLGKYSHYSNSEFAVIERTDPLRYIVGFEEMPADQADWDYDDLVLLVELIGKEVNIHEKSNYLKEKQTVVKTVKGEDTELTVIVHNGPAAHAKAIVRGNGLKQDTYAILTEGDPALYDSEFIGAPFASKDALLKLELENGQTSLLNGELIDLQITLDPALIPAEDKPEDYAIYRFDTENLAWVQLSTQYDPATSTVNAQTGSIGFFVMGVPLPPLFANLPPMTCRLAGSPALDASGAVSSIALLFLPVAGLLFYRRIRRR